jgi:hypothetical protein
MKESKQISLGSSDSTTAPADFKYSMLGGRISITYLGTGSFQRGRGDTPEDRVLAHGIDSIFQDPVPGRWRAGRRGQVGRRERGSYRAAMNHGSKPRRLKQRFSCSCRRGYQHALFKVLIRRAQLSRSHFAKRRPLILSRCRRSWIKTDTSNEVGLRDRGLPSTLA